MVFPILLGGCSGDDPDPGATATASPTAAATAAPATPEPTATNTPDPHYSPLGGKPATEEEKEYYRRKKKAEDLVFSRRYKEAIPLLEQSVEENPKDVDNYFYLMLAHGWLEDVPTKDSKAYKYAEKVREMSPGSNEALRAKRYIAGATFNLPADFKYGLNTRSAQGKFEHYPDETYKVAEPFLLHTDLQPALDGEGQAQLWEGEVIPKEFTGVTVPKGTMVRVKGERAFFYGLTSWRKPLPRDLSKFNWTIFDIAAFYVEITSDGDLKGKEGWMVQHMDRWIDRPGEDPWGVWLSNRIDLSKPFKDGQRLVPVGQPTKSASPKPSPKVTETPKPVATETPEADATPDVVNTPVALPD